MKSFKSTVLPTTRAETQASRDPLSQEQHTNLLTVVIPSIGRPSLNDRKLARTTGLAIKAQNGEGRACRQYDDRRIARAD